MLLKILTALTIFSTISNALILDCTYSVRTHWNVRQGYTCTARILMIGDRQNVTDVSTNHVVNRNNSDVVGLSINNQAIGFLPWNIDEFFPNLQSIDATNSFDEISPMALRGFPDLRQIDLSNNRIQIIEPGLFANNPRLIAINFRSNPVRHVAYGVFKHLNLLQSLRFELATCHSQGAENNRATVEIMIFRISVLCPPTFDMMMDKILSSTDAQRAVDVQIADRINPLMWSIFEMGQKIQGLERRVVELEQNQTTNSLSGGF